MIGAMRYLYKFLEHIRFPLMFLWGFILILVTFFVTYDEKDYSFENISSAMLFLACGLAAIWASIDRRK